MDINIFNEKFNITVSRDMTYTLDSVDNKPYDMEIRAISTIHDGGHYSCHSIAVEDFSDGGTVTIILVGDYCSNVGKDSVILRNDTLIILLDAVIVVLSLKSAMDPGSHDIHRIKNNFGTYYSIYPVGNNYIIYGELEVKMLDEAFREVWTYSTTDILINPDYHLNIDDKQISFTDWDGNHHQLDMDGHLLCYKKRELNAIEINVTPINTPKELQAIIKSRLNMPDFYGMNWDAYWDGITGLIPMPDRIILRGWDIYKEKQPVDAAAFEKIMARYTRLYGHCQCIYT